MMIHLLAMLIHLLAYDDSSVSYVELSASQFVVFLLLACNVCVSPSVAVCLFTVYVSLHLSVNLSVGRLQSW